MLYTDSLFSLNGVFDLETASLCNMISKVPYLSCFFSPQLVGDKVPADIRLTSIKSTTLRVDQSILTGKYHVLAGCLVPEAPQILC